SEAQACVGPRIWAFNGVIHVLRGYCGKRFFQSGERIAQIGEQIGARLCRTWATLVAGLWRRRTIELGGKSEIAAGHVLDLFGKCAHLGWAKGWPLLLEKVWRGTVAPFIGGHGLGGGTHFVFLAFKFAHDRISGRFVPAKFGGSGFLRRRSRGLLYSRPIGRLVAPMCE